MTTDKELLELAAKAAGIELMQFELSDGCFEDAYRTKDGYWNPLTDDGDALRLAVKLKLVIDCCSACAMPTQQDIGWSDGGIPKDPYAATRRAIVRAAAMIGESM